ncbi:Serpin (serine protease inhibitor) [compost metagenome]
MPRFTASYGTDLKEAVQALGVKVAFDPGKGDFSGIAETATPMYISNIIHKTYIEVNESGTEAAASTLVGMYAGGAAPPAEEPFEMIVNRPFIYIIEDIQTGVWLFMGAIENPLLAE